MNSDFYPQLERGAQIEVAHAPDVSDANWVLADVAVLKNDSCDARLADGQFRHDLIFIKDPRIESTTIWAESGRGVFRLSQAEKSRRTLVKKLDGFGKIVDALTKRSETIEVELAKLKSQLAKKS